MPLFKKKEEKVLTKEDQEACMERLYERAVQDKKRNEEKRQATLAHPPGRLPPKKLTGDELASLTTRMYDRQLEHQRLKREKAEKQKDQETQQTKKSLSEEELQESVQRMYNQQRDIKMRTMQKLEKQYHPPPEKKTLSKDQVAALGNRLSHEWKEQKEKAKAKIWERDYAPMEPKRTTINPEEVKAMGERLCTTKGGH